MATIAILGTGTMGFGMAQSMLRAGLSVRAWNRSPAKSAPLAELGATVVSSAAEAVEGADLVITMLFDPESVLQTIAEVVDALASGAVWVQASTIGVAGTQRCAEFATAHGIALLDAPVLGTKVPAEKGQLLMLASGNPALADIVAPAFEAMGNRTLWVSDQVGDATALKLACNAWVVSMVVAVGQSMGLATSLGIDPQLFLDAIKGSQTDAPYLHLKGEQVLKGEYPPSFALDGAVKDVGLIREAATGVGLDTGVLDALLAVFGRASAAGHGDEDMAAVATVFQTAP